MALKYKVVVKVIGHPNGRVFEKFERIFDTKQEAIEFCKENNWDGWSKVSIAHVYVYDTRTDWFPLDEED